MKILIYLFVSALEGIAIANSDSTVMSKLGTALLLQIIQLPVIFAIVGPTKSSASKTSPAPKADVDLAEARVKITPPSVSSPEPYTPIEKLWTQEAAFVCLVCVLVGAMVISAVGIIAGKYSNFAMLLTFLCTIPVVRIATVAAMKKKAA